MLLVMQTLLSAQSSLDNLIKGGQTGVSVSSASTSANLPMCDDENSWHWRVGW